MIRLNETLRVDATQRKQSKECVKSIDPNYWRIDAERKTMPLHSHQGHMESDASTVKDLKYIISGCFKFYKCEELLGKHMGKCHPDIGVIFNSMYHPTSPFVRRLSCSSCR